MAGAFYSVDNRADWDAVFARFDGSGFNDIYFDHRYASLSAGTNQIPRAFIYEAGSSLFFLPMIVSPIDENDTEEQYFDFETPYGYSGPLCLHVSDEFLSNAWQAFDNYCKSNRIIAGLFRFNPLLGNHALAENYSGVEVMLDRHTVYMDLDKDYQTAWNEYASDNRNRIRKAEKLGVTITMTNDLTSLQAFSELYHARMEELDADESYLFGTEYFEKIIELGKDCFQVLLATVGKDLIGGAILLLSDKFVHYHLSSTPREYQKYAANNFLRNAAVKEYVGTHRAKLHFGGGRTSATDDSLLRFKERFSKQRLPFYIGRYIGDADIYGAIRQNWIRSHPDKVEAYANRVLCYRYV